MVKKRTSILTKMEKAVDDFVGNFNGQGMSQIWDFDWDY